MTERPKGTHRPPSVVLVGRLQIIQSLLRLAVGMYWVIWNGRFLGGLAAWPADYSVPAASLGFVQGIAHIVYAFLLLLTAFGLLRLRRGAWLRAMALQGFSLAIGLPAVLRGHPDYLGMVIGVLIVFMLNQRDVRYAFHPPTDTAGMRTTRVREAP